MVTDNEITPEHLDAKFFTRLPKVLLKSLIVTIQHLKKMLDEMMKKREGIYLVQTQRRKVTLRSTAERISIPNTSLQRRLNSWGYSVSEVL